MLIRKTTKICLKMEDDLPEFEEVKLKQRESRFNVNGKQLTFDKYNSPLPNRLKNEYSIELDLNNVKSRGFVTPQMFHASNSEQIEDGNSVNELSNDYIHGLIQNIGRNNQYQE